MWCAKELYHTKRDLVIIRRSTWSANDRSVLFPSSFNGELGQYIHGQSERRAVFLFESNRLRPYSTRRVRQIIHQYAATARIEKRVYPHLFRHSNHHFSDPQRDHQPQTATAHRSRGGEKSRDLSRLGSGK